MEEAATVIRGVTGELLFFARSFLLGFLLRLGYEPLILARKLFRHPKLLVDVQDIVFWTAGSFLMFGLLFRENNGTPRFFSIIGILAGMALYQLGPGQLTKTLFNRLQKKHRQWQKKQREWRRKRWEERVKKREVRQNRRKLQKKKKEASKIEKKRLKKARKDSMIKRQDEHSHNKRGEDSDRKNGGTQESQPQVDCVSTRDSGPLKRNNLDRRKQSGRAKRPESGTAEGSRAEDRRGRSAKRRTRSVQ